MDKRAIQQFADDERINMAIFDFLMTHIRSQRSRDVNFLAARSLAMDFIEDGWEKLKSYKTQISTLDKGVDNIGL